jgi:hypothetical protein
MIAWGPDDPLRYCQDAITSAGRRVVVLTDSVSIIPTKRRGFASPFLFRVVVLTVSVSIIPTELGV